MERYAQTGISLCLCQEQEQAKAARLRTVSQMLTLALLLLGAFGLLRGAFGWTETAWIAAPVGAAAGCLSIWLLTGGTTRRMLVFCGLIAALLVYSMVGGAPLRAAGAGLANGVLETLQEKQGRIYLRFAAQAGSLLPALLPGLALLGCLLALAVLYLPWSGLPLLGVAWVFTALGYLPANPWLAVYSFGCVMLLFRPGRLVVGTGGPALQAALQSAALLGLTAALVLALALPGKLDLSALAQSLRQEVHQLRYERAAQVLPEGELEGLGPRRATDEPMLQVTMDRPVSLYLRTYVGERYTGTEWAALPKETLAASADRFYWLHKTGFYGQSQLSDLARILEFETETVTLSVQSLGVCRENAAIPYGLAGGQEALTDAAAIGDAVCLAGGLTGAGVYTYTADGGLFGQAYALLEALSGQEDTPAVQTYLTREAQYRAFVHDNYLEIPETCLGALEVFLGEVPASVTSYEAKSRIRNCLEENVLYSENPDVVQDPAVDFVVSFLEEQGSGYDVHYASAAVMMLRYLGIPARYVEGYLVTPADVEGAEGETTLTLTGQSAHAWAEYYEDGVGWIPFEASPPYLGVMAESQWRWFQESPEAELESGGSETGLIGGEGVAGNTEEMPEEQPQTNPEAEVVTRPNDAGDRRELQKLWKWFLLALLLLLAGAVLCLALRRRRRLRERAALFADPDAAVAVSALFAHSMEMMWSSGFSRENGPLARQQAAAQRWFGAEVPFERMALWNEEAMFSRHNLTVQQREEMAEYQQSALACFRGKLKPLQRLYQRWIRCMY